MYYNACLADEHSYELESQGCQSTPADIASRWGLPSFPWQASSSTAQPSRHDSQDGSTRIRRVGTSPSAAGGGRRKRLDRVAEQDCRRSERSLVELFALEA